MAAHVPVARDGWSGAGGDGRGRPRPARVFRVPHAALHAPRRADEDEARLGDRVREVTILAEEAVAGMDRVRAGAAGGGPEGVRAPARPPPPPRPPRVPPAGPAPGQAVPLRPPPDPPPPPP